nr:hypothetical protein CFP56_40957 [Quercus suber]
MVSEGAGDEVKMMIQKDNTTSVRAITLRVTGSLITNVLLMWSIQYGLELATQTETYIGEECNFNAGIITMVLGFVLMFVEIHILATMFLDFATEKRQEQEEENHQGMYLELAENLEQQEELEPEEKNDSYQEREMTIREVIVCLFVDVIIVFMLLWIIFTALGLTLEPIGDGQYSIHHYLIKSVVGNVTALIGFCYFAFGVGIAVELSCMLQPKEKKGSSIHEEHNTNLECLV